MGLAGRIIKGVADGFVHPVHAGLGIIGGTGKVMGKFADHSRPDGWFSKAGQGWAGGDFVPRVATWRGFGVVTAGMLGVQLISDMHNNMGNVKTGRVSYADGPSKMTKPFTSGIVEAMQDASQGNYEIFSELASDVLKSPNALARMDDLGANPKMISALYNMR